MYLSLKPKYFCQYLIAYLEYTKNFEHFEKTLGSQSLSILEIIHSKKRGYLNV